ncbi:hypothetical protein FGU64_11555 [Mesorhizobium sp. 8]|nr:hypothetical protein FGU64_11555 [Mesorhizobium sp. 8]
MAEGFHCQEACHRLRRRRVASGNPLVQSFDLHGDWGSFSCKVLEIEPSRTLASSWAASGLESVGFRANAMGRPRSSLSAWMLVVRPPREVPMA